MTRFVRLLRSFCLVMCILPLSIYAQVHLPEIFSDNMVLQQDSKVRIWGTATPQSTVSVTGSWNDETVSTKVDSNGKWMVELQTIKASFTPYYIVISDDHGISLRVSNVLLGDVWLCSGQSNMEMPVRGWLPDCPIDYADQIAQSSTSFPGIRCVMIKEIKGAKPLDECKGTWQLSTPENVPDFSAVAYSFAMHLSQYINTPIGLIVSAWGGTNIEGWMPESYLQKYKNIHYNYDVASNDGKAASVLYNGMIYPLRGYTLKGFIWYQGEANVWDWDGTYYQKQKDLIECWRKDWGQGELPFYMVEIAPFNYPLYNAPANCSPLIREEQLKAALTIPHCGLVSTNDLTKETEIAVNIHPANKLQIGYRLCRFALANDYGRKSECWGPIYQSMKLNGSKAVLSFSHVGKGFIPNSNIIGFEIAGNNRIFYSAKARIVDTDKIEVYAEEVTDPVAVRYCFSDVQLGNLKSMTSFPVYPFRTDNWIMNENK